MAVTAYMTVKGQKQGDIQGGVTQKGHERSIAVHAFNHQVTTPRDAASGLPTGRRMHGPVIILKENDKSSPLLWNALITNENLVTVELKFWSPLVRVANGAGAETQSYTIRLTNANISSIRESMLDNQDPDNLKFGLREEVSFVYQKIEWTWTDGGITAQDDSA